jgi:hypothetical protein
VATKEQKKRSQEVALERASEIARKEAKELKQLEKWEGNPYVILGFKGQAKHKTVVDITEEGRALIVDCLARGQAISTIASKLGMSKRHLFNIRKDNDDLEELFEVGTSKLVDEMVEKLIEEAREHEGKSDNKAAKWVVEYLTGHKPGTVRGEEKQNSNPTQVNVQINMRAPMSSDSDEFRAKYGELESGEPSEVVTDAEVVNVEPGDSD